MVHPTGWWTNLPLTSNCQEVSYILDSQKRFMNLHKSLPNGSPNFFPKKITKSKSFKPPKPKKKLQTPSKNNWTTPPPSLQSFFSHHLTFGAPRWFHPNPSHNNRIFSGTFHGMFAFQHRQASDKCCKMVRAWKAALSVSVGGSPLPEVVYVSPFHFESKKNIRGEMVFFSWGGATFDDSFMIIHALPQTQLSRVGFIFDQFVGRGPLILRYTREREKVVSRWGFCLAQIWIYQLFQDKFSITCFSRPLLQKVKPQNMTPEGLVISIQVAKWKLWQNLHL